MALALYIPDDTFDSTDSGEQVQRSDNREIPPHPSPVVLSKEWYIPCDANDQQSFALAMACLTIMTFYPV